MDDYTKKIIFYINNQKFQGKLGNYSKKLTLKSTVCGDYNDIYILIENEFITDIAYENSGCALNISTLEILCEYLLNKNISEIKNLDETKISQILDFPKSKHHCINLTLDTLKQY